MRPFLRQYRIALALAILVGGLAVAPYVLQTFSPLYQGMTVTRDKDYFHYQSRLGRVLAGYPSVAENGTTPVGSGIVGLQSATMERIVGFTFGWLGLPAPTLSVVVTGVLATVLFLLFVVFFNFVGFSVAVSTGMTTVYFAILFHVVTRVMHPGWSYVLVLGSLIAFFRFLQKPSVLTAVLAGVLLGILPSLYFWGWTYAWAVAGCGAVIWLLWAEGRKRLLSSWPLLTVLALVTVAVAAPALLQLSEISHSPLYPEAAIRMSMLYQRTPESWPRSIVIVTQLLLLLSFFRKQLGNVMYRFTLAMVAGGTLALHQNILHNQVLMFSSHYYPFLVLSALVAGVWALGQWKTARVRLSIIVAITAALLGGAALDYLPGYTFFVPQPYMYEHQHLKTVLPELTKAGTGANVLTDAVTGQVITAWTPVGVVYTRVLRHLLLSDADIAERYCVSNMFSVDPPDLTKVIYLEYNRVLQSPQMVEHEATLVRDACARVQQDPKVYLRKYGVTHVLWNEEQRPTWNIDAATFGLVKIADGPQWHLWRVPTQP